MWLLLPNFRPSFLIKFSENPKITKKNENPKKYVFNIFASFLAFSTSSKKNFKFSKVFRTRSTFHISFLKSSIFLIESTLILLVFKKYKTIKKNQIYKKKKKLRDQFWGPSNILPINIGPQLTQRGSWQFCTIERTQKTLKIKTLSSPSLKLPPTPHLYQKEVVAPQVVDFPSPQTRPSLFPIRISLSRPRPPRFPRGLVIFPCEHRASPSQTHTISLSAIPR